MTYADEKLSHDVAVSWIQDIAGFVSPPDIMVRIFELVESNASTSTDIAAVVSHDTNMTGRLLKIVNSPIYNFQGKIDTVSRAVSIVGTKELVSLVISVTAVKSFSKIPNNIINMDSFWRHSIFTALICKELAARCDILHPERLFVMGLLHEVGMLVMCSRAPEVVRDLLLAANGDEEALNIMEKQEFGFTHAELGGMLLKSWKLPESILEAVTYHHEPLSAEVARLESCLLFLATGIAAKSGLGQLFEHEYDESPFKVEPAIWEVLPQLEKGFNEQEIIEIAGVDFLETATLLTAGL